VRDGVGELVGEGAAPDETVAVLDGVGLRAVVGWAGR
jgi:hypothetical protein